MAPDLQLVFWFEYLTSAYTEERIYWGSLVIWPFIPLMCIKRGRNYARSLGNEHVLDMTPPLKEDLNKLIRLTLNQ